jgi:hypothetical protein
MVRKVEEMTAVNGSMDMALGNGTSEVQIEGSRKNQASELVKQFKAEVRSTPDQRIGPSETIGGREAKRPRE